MTTHDEDEKVLAHARKLGTEAGTNAASWYLVTNEQEARKVLQGIEEGDPEVLDSFPTLDLSGEWADVPSGPDVVRMVLNDADVKHTGAGDNHAPGTCNRCDWWDEMGTLLDDYEQAYTTAVEDEIARMARYQIA